MENGESIPMGGNVPMNQRGGGGKAAARRRGLRHWGIGALAFDSPFPIRISPFPIRISDFVIRHSSDLSP